MNINLHPRCHANLTFYFSWIISPNGHCTISTIAGYGLTSTKENHFTSKNLLFCWAMFEKRSYYKDNVILCQLFHRSFVKPSLLGITLEFYWNKESKHSFQKLKMYKSSLKVALLKLDLQGVDKSYANCFVDIWESRTDTFVFTS